MNDLQIRYFLKAAQRLNFSEAAKELFISQPALSQQITAIESELNMQLFIRDKNKLRLTPAATVLLRELPECSRRFQAVIDKARVVSEGHSGILRFGVLEGQILPPNFRLAYHAFRKTYPNVHVELCMESFARLRQRLDAQELDAALTINFDVKDSSAYFWVKTDPDVCAILVSTAHPLAEKSVRSWKDLKHETIVLVDSADSSKVNELVVNDCRQAGFNPQLLLAPSLNEQMLWIDAGLGVGISNTDTYVYANPHIRCLKKLPIAGNYFVISWHRDNTNSSIALFTNFVASYIEEHGLLS